MYLGAKEQQQLKLALPSDMMMISVRANELAG